MTSLPFQQVDVFTTKPFCGNPLAVVVGADALSDEAMARLANWTNLSETTFLLKPTVQEADYRVRIFTPQHELPFAGHPTLGSCHVWLRSGGMSKTGDIVQQCSAGLIRIRRHGDRLAFAAPPLVRSGSVAATTLAQIAHGLGIELDAIKASQWADNGPGWIAIMLATRAEVLALRPDYAALSGQPLGVIAPCSAADDIDADFEVRAFTSWATEDPVTGSLNAGLAQWLIGAGLAPPSYTASQGTVLGRSGRVYAERDGNDTWIGGNTVTCIEGRIAI